MARLIHPLRGQWRCLTAIFEPFTVSFIARVRWLFWSVAVVYTAAACAADSGGQPTEEEFLLANTNTLAELSPDELINIKIASVYSASKHEQKVSQAPSAVSIVTSDDIQRYGYRTLAEVLQGVRGFYVSYDRNYSYIGVRGFSRPGDYNARLLFMVDGHRLNDNIYDGGLVGTEEFLDVDLIDRVEIIRGPSSSIYGNSAFLGVINILTRKGADVKGVEVSGSAGTFDTLKGRLTYGTAFDNGLDLLVSGSWYESAGDRRLYYPEFDTPENNNGIAEDSDEDYSRSLFTRVTWGELSLSGGVSWRKKNVPTASFGTIFNDGHETSTDVRAFSELKYDHEFEKDLRLLARAYYDRYEYYGVYPFNYADPGDPIARTLNIDETIGDWVGAEVQLTKALLDRHTLILGSEYRENLRQFQHNYDDRPRFNYVNTDNQSRSFGLYAQTEIAFRTNLLFNAGVRYDYYSTFGNTVNPRAGLIYSPWEPTALKLLYGRAFRAPSDFELYYYSSDFSGSAEDLDPETIDTYEFVFEQQLSEHYRFSSSLYAYEIRDLISQQEDEDDGTLFFANVEKVRAAGVEVELEGHYKSGLQGRVSYAFQRAEDVTAENELSNSPRHLAKLGVQVPLYRENIFAGLELQYTGETLTFRGNTADDFLVANMTLFSRELIKGLEASVSVYNLFDTRYGYSGAGDHVQNVIQSDGRTFRVKLTYRF